MSLREQKTSLRKRVEESLKKLEPEEVERQSAIITKHVLQMPAYQNAKSIAIFLSMPGKEVSTGNIVLQAFEDGKSVFVPYLHAGREPKSKVMDMLQLRNKDDFQSLKPDAWGIPSLSKDSVDQRENALGGIGVSDESTHDQKGVSNLDLMFMPAVAFDRSHRRLGHGKGFYDRYLSTYKNAVDSSEARRKMPYLVGLALHQQMLLPGENIPVDDNDWLVDEVVVAET
ncbi:5-formyltetrahydrofolate cyclo-ligase [Exophiala viscosa]|uniref:5-formyltetrahydrofolate cyclo-ligase n=2 Tax=Exophiala viscosa TaxID=2486360 RepID=A0AAN6E0P2_9EURO|nr:5-formyltetrahydrofolate cyclo-ligase [Exophiala viscosa]